MLDKYSASLKKAIEEAMQPVLTKIDGRADKTDDLIKGLGDLMLGHVDLGKLSRGDRKAALRLQKIAIHNQNAQILVEEKAEREAKKLLKKGKGIDKNTDIKKNTGEKNKEDKSRIVNKHNCVDKMKEVRRVAAGEEWALAASGGGAASSMPPVEAVSEQLVAEQEAHQLAVEQEAFMKLKLNRAAKVMKLQTMISEDGPCTPFLQWAESKWPKIFEEAHSLALAEANIPDLE